MENPQPAADRGETLAQVLADIKHDAGRTERQIADSIDVHVSTFNTWINGKAAPRRESLEKLADSYPAYKGRLFAASGKRVPGPFSPTRRDAVLEIFDRMTEEQQDIYLIQGKAVADSNEQKG